MSALRSDGIVEIARVSLSVAGIAASSAGFTARLHILSIFRDLGPLPLNFLPL